jgi:Raf kinase inhibitor-like YbhB/YbcL family protein
LALVVAASLAAGYLLLNPPVQPIYTIRLSSDLDHGQLVTDPTCSFADIAPTLNWGSVPSGTKELVVTAVDDISPSPSATEWLVYDIPPDAHSVGQILPPGAMQGLTWRGDVGYRGPCNTQIAVHRYLYDVFALDSRMNFKAGLTRETVLAALEEHVIGKGHLGVIFTLASEGPSALRQLRAYSQDPELGWNTSGVGPGTYIVEAWARHIGSPNDPEVTATTSVALTTNEAHCGVGLIISPADPQPPGAVITVTAVPQGCAPATRFRFFVSQPKQPYQVTQESSVTTNYSWKSAQPGTYGVAVWAQQPGSTAPYDAAAYSTFAIGDSAAGALCTGATVEGEPQISAPGTLIHILMRPKGCSPSEVRYWYRSAEAIWKIGI